MRILFVSLGWPKVGEHNLYSDLLGEFARRGHKVSVITLDEKSNQPLTSVSYEEGVRVLRVKSGKIQKTDKYKKIMSSILAVPKMIYAITRYMKKDGFDLILFSTPPITLTPFVIFLKLRYQAKLYLLLKDIWPQVAVDLGEIRIGGVFWYILRGLEKLTYRTSDYIGCMSPANVSYLRKHNPKLKEKIIEVCPNSQIIREIPSVNEAFLKNKYGLPDDKLILIYGGNLGKAQGVEFIRDVIREYQKDERVYLLILGAGTEFKFLKQEIERIHPPNAKLLPQVSVRDYEELLSVCDIGLIFLDRKNTVPNFPSRLLSYLNAKLPVMVACDQTTDIGSIVETAGGGKNALSGDMEGFKHALEAILSSEETRKNMGEKGYQLFLKRYTVEKSYEVILQHFEQRIISQPQPRISFIKKELTNRRKVLSFSSKLYYLLGRNRIYGNKDNKIRFENCFLKNCRVHIIGKNNVIYAKNLCVLKNCTIFIRGENNKVLLGEKVSAVNCDIHIEDRNNLVRIGQETHISGRTHLACIEGRKLIIGRRCLFSSEVTFRTGDSHSILNLQGERVNPSQDIIIGEHVWIGNRTIITKGVKLAKNSVVATGAIVTKSFDTPNIIVGGVPATIIKKDINWEEKRI